MCSLLRKDIMLGKVIPSLRLLVNDASEHVRASMAGVVNDLAPILGREDTVELLLPMLLELLRDESSDVRLNIISNLDTINSVVGVELLSQSLLPAIVDLAEDTKWRVRFAIIELIPRVAEQLGCEFFNEKLNNLCMVWMGDDVYSIRRAAANNLHKLAALFGEDWAKEQIFPRIERMHTHTNYLQRMTSLYSVQVLVKTMSLSTLETIIIPLIVQMVTDAVPNVRLTVARTLKDIISSNGSGMHESFLSSCIVPSLKTLSADSDRDVRFYSTMVSSMVILWQRFSLSVCHFSADMIVFSCVRRWRKSTPSRAWWSNVVVFSYLGQKVAVLWLYLVVYQCIW